VNDTVLNSQPRESNHIEDENCDLPLERGPNLLIDLFYAVGKLISCSKQPSQ